MKEFMKYPSIDQYRNAVKLVKNYIKWNNISESKPFEVLLTGTVKIHGTNAAIGYCPETGEVWAQSRNNIITPQNDNFGFAFWVHANMDKFKAAFEKVYGEEGGNIYVFGEWFGGNIQKGVGVNGLKKGFCMFDVYADDGWEKDFNDFANELEFVWEIPNIHHKFDFDTEFKKVDFIEPEKFTNYFADITQAVEDECPVAKYFGVDNGVGEGVVWTGWINGEPFRFKVKGQKHSSSKTKEIAKVDTERLESISHFVEYAVTVSRLDQGAHELGFGKELDRTKTGDFVRWIANDIIKEEADTLVDNGLEWSDVASQVSKRAASWFIENYG